MAKVSITRRWPDGDSVKVSIEVATSYPDALSQARTEAKRALADACDVVLTDDGEPDALPALPTEIPGVERNTGWGDEGN
jgi:hypothetical protein